MSDYRDWTLREKVESCLRRILEVERRIEELENQLDDTYNELLDRITKGQKANPR